MTAPTPQATDSTPASKAVVEKQAKELEAMRAELDALKKQPAEQNTKTNPKAKPKAIP